MQLTKLLQHIGGSLCICLNTWNSGKSACQQPFLLQLSYNLYTMQLYVTVMYILLFSCISILIGNATRICNSDGKWESPIVTNCSSYEFSNLINLIYSRQVIYSYIANKIIVNQRVATVTKTSWQYFIYSQVLLKFLYIQRNTKTIQIASTGSQLLFKQCLSSLSHKMI